MWGFTLTKTERWLPDKNISLFILILVEEIVKKEEGTKEHCLHFNITIYREDDHKSVSIGESFLGNVRRLFDYFSNLISFLIKDVKSYLGAAACGQDTWCFDGVDDILVGVDDLEKPTHGAR